MYVIASFVPVVAGYVAGLAAQKCAAQTVLKVVGCVLELALDAVLTVGVVAPACTQWPVCLGLGAAVSEKWWVVVA